MFIQKKSQTDTADKILFVPASVILAFTWLMPNHQMPWTSFHHDAWMAMSLVFMLLVVGWQTKWMPAIPSLALVVLGMSAIPLLQYQIELLPSLGLASISALYLLAIFLSLVLGFSIQGEKTDVFWSLIFGAILFAGLLNVAIQIVQWLREYDEDYLSLLGFWVTRISDNSRPSGSLLQPNQLATFQVWAVLSLVWLYLKNQVGKTLAIIALISLLAGISLTQSRVGFIELILLFFLAFFFPKTEVNQKCAWILGVSVLLSICFSLALPYLTDFVHGEGYIARNIATDNGRLTIFRIFAQSIFESPWAGYGLGNLGSAFLVPAAEYPHFYPGTFANQSHNVILDFLLWFGIPVGVVLVWVFFNSIKSAKKKSEEMVDGYIFFGLVFALIAHSMVELPHQFLYFVVPFGLFLGYLLPNNPVVKVTGNISRIYWIAAGTLGLMYLSVIAVDYLKIQERYTEWRFENQKIGRPLRAFSDDILILRNFSDELAQYRVPPVSGLSDAQISQVKKIAMASNTAPMYYHLVLTLALNDHREEALIWMWRLNAISGRSNWVQIRESWRRDQVSHPAIQDLQWPERIRERE